MIGCILHRMIFWELVKVFVLCLLGITGILLMAGIVAEASQQGLNPAQILAIIPLLIPSTLPYTIPATTLFATCVVYGRLAADNEILAIRASGIHLFKVVGPGVLLGALMSGATMALYYELIPSTHHLMRSMFLADVEELLYTMLKKNNQISYPHFDYSIYVRAVQGRRLIDPTFMHKNAKGEIDAVAQSEEAELHVDLPRRLLLVRMFRGWAWGNSNETRASFEKRDWEVPLPEDLTGKYASRPRDLTWLQILGQIARTYTARVETDTFDGEFELQDRLDEAEALLPTKGQDEELRKHLVSLQNKLKAVRGLRLQLRAELQMRPALALGCLFFVLVGCPVGIWFSRSDYLSSFITCFLPIVFLYYPLLLCGTGMAKDGKFDPALTVWAADVVMAVIGLYLFRKLLKN